MPKYLQTESDLIAGDDATLKQLVVEARAKIIWGDRIRDVEKWLVMRGVPPEQVRIIIDSSARERGIAIRRLGWRDICIGSLPIVIGSTCLYLVLKNGVVLYSEQKDFVAALMILALGILMIGRGILRLVQGANALGSIPDMK